MVNPPGNKALSRLAAVALVVALLFVVALNAASAQEPEAVAAPRPQPTDTMVTVLRPGDNLVGWIEPEASVANLFNAVAEVETVWAWDALERQWLVASRDVPVELHTLQTLKPGMGLLVQVGGNESVEWTRSAYPVRGLVELQAGYNLVAWSGPDGAPIEQFSKGIGWSLRSVRRWDAAAQQWSTWTSPERSAQLIAVGGSKPDASDGKSELLDTRRGDAFWVEVSRSVNWLQPTGILPTIEFPGSAPADVRAKAQELVSNVISFYSEHFGFEADASSYSIWFPSDVDALVRAAADIGYDDRDPNWYLRENWDGGSSWVDSLAHGLIHDVIIMRHRPDPQASSWPTLAHEYFHIVQHQLSPGFQAGLWVPAWLSEGTAEWATDEYHAVTAPGRWNQDERREQQCRSAADAPPLQYYTVGDGLNASQYLLGWLAVSYLRERSGSDSWLELWRHGAQTKIGAHRRWESLLPWQAWIHYVAGVSLERFYTAFDAWLRDQTDACADPEGVDHKGASIRGRLVAEDNRSFAGTTIVAARVVRGANVEVAEPAVVRADGGFVIDVPRDGIYRIAVELSEACILFWYAGSGLDRNRASASLVVVRDGAANLEITVPKDTCGLRKVNGSVVGPSGIGLPGIRVHVGNVNRGLFSTFTNQEGSFAGIALTTGLSGLLLELDEGCLVPFGPDGPARAGTLVEWIGGMMGDVAGIRVRVPENKCVRQINGRLISADGQPLADVLVEACLEDVRCRWIWGRAWGRTDDDGVFAITVPEEDSYYLKFSLDADVCTIHFSADGLTTRWEDRLVVRIADRDLRLSSRQIPPGMCEYRISGRVVDITGAPIASSWMNVTESTHLGGIRTGVEGQFAVRVPFDGAYRFDIWLTDDCAHRFSGQALGSSSNPVRVRGADVTGVVLRLPGTVEEICR